VKFLIAITVAAVATIVNPSVALTSGSYTTTTSTGATLIHGTTNLHVWCDDCHTMASTPFPVKFYGASYGTIGISSNGNIQFGSGTPFDGYFNGCLPQTDFTEPVLMAYWDDLITSPKASGNGIFTGTTGTAPNRTFVVEWRAALFSGGTALDFEVVFSENSPNISVIYGSGPFGQAETVGVQESGTGPETQFVCNGPGVSAGKKLTFVYSASGGGGVPPTVSTVNNQLTVASIPTAAGAIPVITTWVGTDPDDAIVSYQAQIRVNGGTWTDLSLSPPTATSVSTDLTPNQLVNFRIRATDAGGHTGAWALGTSFRVKTPPETAASFTGSWTAVSDANAWGGTVMRSTTLNADATITFTGRNLAMVATRGPAYGSVDVYVDGTFYKTLKCNSPTVMYKQVIFRYSTQVLTNSTHTVRIVNDATPGHPQIDIDGFISFQSG
jgi:hypothetical protein